jgi:(2Fe-2S) ferredoxin
VLSVDEEDSEIKPKYVMVYVNRRSCADRTSNAALGSINLADALGRIITAHKIDVKFERSICMAQCQKGPTVRVAPGGRFILRATIENVVSFLDELEHLCGIQNA